MTPESNHTCIHEADWGALKAELPAIRATLARIEVQTTLTNGRVRELELARAKTGGVLATLAVIGGLVGGLIGPLVTFVLRQIGG